MEKNNFRQLVNTPADLAAGFVQWYDGVLNKSGITWGIPAIDAVITPMRPGDLVGLVARPGHGKSSLMAYLARTEARRIVARGTQDKEVVVYVTWENSAEEIETFFLSDGTFSSSDVAWGRVPRDEIVRKMAKRAAFPLWIFGHSVARAGRPMPRMTLPAVLSAIETMEADYGKRPTLLLFDYIQLIPVTGMSGRAESVQEVPPLVKELAMRVGVPAVCGVQAARDVDDLRIKIPLPRHCQWASSIEQAADKLFGLWMPYKTEPTGAPPIEVAPGKSAPITETLLIMKNTKQRFDRANHTFALNFAPQYLRLEQMSSVTYSPPTGDESHGRRGEN